MKALLLKGFCIIVWLITDYLVFYILAEKAHSCFFTLPTADAPEKSGQIMASAGTNCCSKSASTACADLSVNVYKEFQMFQWTHPAPMKSGKTCICYSVYQQS
jgi:hypothetical protein